MCEFQSLYFGDDGYVVRCKQCGNYQAGFISTMLTLTENDFYALCKIVRLKNTEPVNLPGYCKSIILPTPAQGFLCCLQSRR